MDAELGNCLPDIELKGADLTATALTMLLGEEGKEFAYYEEDEKWWVLRLYTRIN